MVARLTAAAGGGAPKLVSVYRNDLPTTVTPVRGWQPRRRSPCRRRATPRTRLMPLRPCSPPAPPDPGASAQGFTGCIDYLLLSSSAADDAAAAGSSGGSGVLAQQHPPFLQVAAVGLLELPAREGLGDGCPNGEHPSDHLALVADMVFSPTAA